jgi:AraC family transcriptional regulator of arabinose operon
MLSKPDLNLSGELFRLGQAYHFLSLAIESYETNNRKSGVYSSLSSDDYVRFAIRHIQNNYSNLKIQSLADNIGLNRTYFTAIFKEKMYMSPQEYLMQVRMKHACDLLKETDLPIKMIASSVGYENALTFSKIFKHKEGVSPLDYRKNGESL